METNNLFTGKYSRPQRGGTYASTQKALQPSVHPGLKCTSIYLENLLTVYKLQSSVFIEVNLPNYYVSVRLCHGAPMSKDFGERFHVGIVTHDVDISFLLDAQCHPDLL